MIPNLEFAKGFRNVLQMSNNEAETFPWLGFPMAGGARGFQKAKRDKSLLKVMFFQIYLMEKCNLIGYQKEGVLSLKPDQVFVNGTVYNRMINSMCSSWQTTVDYNDLSYSTRMEWRVVLSEVKEVINDLYNYIDLFLSQKAFLYIIDSSLIAR